jgi:hypothetical protein
MPRALLSRGSGRRLAGGTRLHRHNVDSAHLCSLPTFGSRPTAMRPSRLSRGARRSSSRLHRCRSKTRGSPRSRAHLPFTRPRPAPTLDRNGRRRADRRPVTRVDAVAPVDGARSRNSGAQASQAPASTGREHYDVGSDRRPWVTLVMCDTLGLKWPGSSGL